MRLICFVFIDWEPSGGWGDVLRPKADVLEQVPSPACVFSSEEEAFEYAKQYLKGCGETNLIEIVDLDTLLLVARYTNCGGVTPGSSGKTWARLV